MKQFMLVALSVLGYASPHRPVAVQAQAKAKAGKTMSATRHGQIGVRQLARGDVGAKDMTFTVDNTTAFTGKGLSTKSKPAGGTLAATDAVHEGDMVAVSYHDMNGTMHASSVRITSSKAMPAKK